MLYPPGSVVLETEHDRMKPHIKIAGVEYKHCSCCENWLQLDQFYKVKTWRRWDGLSNSCRSCHRVRVAKVYWRNKDALHKK